MHFHRLAPTVIADHLMTDFKIGATGTGFFAAAFFYSYAVMQVPAGRLIDRFGPRLTTAWGLTLVAIATAMVGWAPSIQWAIATRIIAGAGASVLFAATVKRVAEEFPAHMFAAVHGTMLTLQNLSGMLILIPMASITNSLGWRWLFFTAGGAALLLAIANGLAVSPPNHNPVRTGGGEPAPPTLVPIRGALRQIIVMRQTWPPFLVFLGSYSPYLAFSGLWGVPWLMNMYGLSRESATAVMLGFAGGALFVPPLLGWACERCQSYRVPLIWGMVACTLGWAALGMGLWLELPFVVMLVLIIIVGSASSSFGPTFAVIKHLHPPQLLGVASGWQNSAGFLGGMILQPVLGWVIDLFAIYDPTTQQLIPTASSYVTVIWVSTLVAGVGLAAAFSIPHRLAAGAAQVMRHKLADT